MAMKCQLCGQAVSEDANFCGGCGATISIRTAETEIINPRETNEETILSDPLFGHTLDGRYEILSRIGGGGMGTVYRARRINIGDEVAVKVLHSNFTLDKETVERFRREARSAASIRHSNVVTIHDFSEAKADGTPAYIVMELVGGPSLRELIEREGRLRPERAVMLMRDVCAGVGVAHRAGLVHRDLKPDNIIVVPAMIEDERETAKVVDFGLAKLRDGPSDFRLTQTGAVMGTPYYMSPEQCRGEELDARADVYSLGAILYEMLSGNPPFNAKTLGGIISQHLNDPPPDFPPLSAVPPSLEAVCRRALSKNPDERQREASALGRELQAAIAQPATSSQPSAPQPLLKTMAAPQAPPAMQAVAQKKKSFRALWIAGGLFVLVLFAGLIASLIYLRTFFASRGTSTVTNRGQRNSPVKSDARPIGAANTNDAGRVNPSSEENDNSAPLPSANDLRGSWAGTYGPLDTPATLLIQEQQGSNFSGVLEQSGVRVALTGVVDWSSRQVRIKETRVLSGSDWSLGEDTGELSADGRSMSGTGSDAQGAQLGLSYQWSFSKQQ